jgi:hypothetical protein
MYKTVSKPLAHLNFLSGVNCYDIGSNEVFISTSHKVVLFLCCVVRFFLCIVRFPASLPIRTYDPFVSRVKTSTRKLAPSKR